MDTEKQIQRLERQIAIKKIARQYNVSDRYVRYIIDGDRQPNKKSGNTKNGMILFRIKITLLTLF